MFKKKRRTGDGEPTKVFEMVIDGYADAEYVDTPTPSTPQAPEHYATPTPQYVTTEPATGRPGNPTGVAALILTIAGIGFPVIALPWVGGALLLVGLVLAIVALCKKNLSKKAAVWALVLAAFAITSGVGFSIWWANTVASLGGLDVLSGL